MLKKTFSSKFLKGKPPKKLILLNCFLAILYFNVLLFAIQRGSTILFIILMIGEIFHLWQALSYCYTIWSYKAKHDFNPSYFPNVDVFIPVTGEPVDIVEETVQAAMSMNYPNFTVNILNDGFVAKKENWRDVEILAKKLNIKCITRQVAGGAKAGNLNNAMRETNSEFIAVFDADMVPHKDFLKKMMGYFIDEKVAFVQSPQYYKNMDVNGIATGAWDQQALFFGPILRGKDRLNSVFMCGTNMVLRRKTIDQVGGMCETNIAEDFLTSLFVHEKGWKSVYVSEVLSEGLAPEDFLSYYKQQFRWCRGSLEVIFKYNPLFRKGLSIAQKIQYLSSASYYLSGPITLMNALLPLIYLYLGQTPITSSTMLLATAFVPYILINLYTLQASGNFTFTFKALSFSVSSFWIQIKALIAVLTGQKTTFSVTSKTALKGNFLKLVIPHITYIIVAVGGIGLAIYRVGSITPALLTNVSWAVFNIIIFIPFIMAAAPEIKFPKLFLKNQYKVIINDDKDVLTRSI